MKIYGYYWDNVEGSYDNGQVWGFTSREKAEEHARIEYPEPKFKIDIEEHIIDDNEPLCIYTGE